MDIVDYYTELSKRVALEDKVIKSFSDELDSKLTKINHLRINTSLGKKIMHPFRTIKNAANYKELSVIRRDLDLYINSDVMLYDNGDYGEPIEDLEGAATYYKPAAIREYVKTQRMVLSRIK